MGSGSNWCQTGNKAQYILKFTKFYKKKKKKIDIYVHRLESVVFDMKMCMLQART